MVKKSSIDSYEVPFEELSKRERLLRLPYEKRQAFFDSLTEEEAERLLYDWFFNGRPKQLEGWINTDWFIWIILSGRGFGKTRVGAETVHHWVANGYVRIGVIAPTISDLRDVIVEGESGILATAPPWARPHYEPTKRRLTWDNGAIVSLYSGEEPERLRGPQHDALWMDELAGFSSGEIMMRCWDMANFGLRLGKSPRILISTTPKPLPLIQKLVKSSKIPEERILLTVGSTYENKSNLAPTFFKQIVRYEGTNLGRQEIHAELIDLEEQGIIKRSWFKLWPADEALPYFMYIIQSYDTAFTEKTNNDPTACTVWGVFRPDADSPPAVMLLDAWSDRLKYPDLRKKVTETFFGARYGDSTRNGIALKGQKADLILIEDKGSGITLIQDLARTGVPIRAYNPGKMDKVQRLHAVSHLPANGRVWIPESLKTPNEPRTWANEFIEEVCVFPNAENDDYVDTFSQMLALLRDEEWISIDEFEEEEVFADTIQERHKRLANPYSV